MVEAQREPVAKDLLLIYNFLNLVKINKLVVPELVEVTSSDVILDCQFTANDDNFTLQWIFNNGVTPIYEWSTHTDPKITGILDGRIDLSYHVSGYVCEEHRALRITNLTTELSGDYTCVVVNRGAEARQTKTMMIYSVEYDIEMATEWRHNSNIIDFSCAARNVYPQPDLTIEYNNVMVSGQYQRVWRNHGGLYDVNCFARAVKAASDEAVVACRLYIAQADYTAIKKKILLTGGDCCCRSSWKITLTCFLISIYFIIYAN